MHELAITQSVVDAVTDRTGATPVAIVRLRVGRSAGVVPDAMRFCFELVTAGTPLEGAALEIEQPEGRPLPHLWPGPRARRADPALRLRQRRRRNAGRPGARCHVGRAGRIGAGSLSPASRASRTPCDAQAGAEGGRDPAGQPGEPPGSPPSRAWITDLLHAMDMGVDHPGLTGPDPAG